MDFKRLTDRAKDLVAKRGGTDSLKQDADELKGIAKGEGSLTEKAKAAAAALKEPGAHGPAVANPEPATAEDHPEPTRRAAEQGPPAASRERPGRAERKERREARREQRQGRDQP